MRHDPETGSAPRQVRRGRSHDLTTLVYEELREAIVGLKLAPGAGLAEVDIGRRLAVSRTPVRGALTRLQRDGLILNQGAGGPSRFVVAPLTSADMRELFLMVGALDAVAARMAAELPYERRQAVVASMTALNQTLCDCSAGTRVTDIPRVQGLDLRFHQAYEKAAAGPQLLSQLEGLHARRARYVRVYTAALLQAHSVRESCDEHQAIIEAIGRGDADGAERSAAFNYRNGLSRYARMVSALGERGTWQSGRGSLGLRRR